jgi:cation diffusion facilitator family transporter
MITPDEIPDRHRDAIRRARRLEWITLAYLASCVVVLRLAMGSSQALKSEWIDDLVSMVAPIAFLVSAHFDHKKPNPRFPYGFHRAATVSFFAGSVALLGIGGYIAIESLVKLVSKEHAHVDSVPIALAAIAWSGIPAYLLGKKKRKCARELDDKGLLADADTNRADAVSAGAAAVGVVGLSIGWWWADAVAALVISIDIIWDGFKAARGAVHDLLDGEPQTLEGRREPIVTKLAAEARTLPWAERTAVRMRRLGHILQAEVFVVPKRPVTKTDLGAAGAYLRRLDDRLNLVVIPVDDLPIASA